jgi:hypothetical protein
MSDVNPAISNGGKTVGSRRFPWGRWVFRLVLLAIVVLIGGALWCVYDAVSEALHAEKGLHATNLTIEAVAEYLDKHNGAWPRSWKELEQSSSQMGEAYRFAGGSDKIQEFVAFDFNADPDRLAQQTDDEFAAIKPVGPRFESYRIEVPFLLETLRRTRHTKGR